MSSTDQEEQEQLALGVAKHIKRSATRASKQSISKSQRQPLRSPIAGASAGASTTPTSNKQWLQQCEELYASLPKNSQWAKHKLKVVSQAIKLLKKAAAERTSEEAAELQRLLGTLKLGVSSRSAAAAAAAGGGGGAGGLTAPEATIAAAASVAAAAQDADMPD